MRRAVLFIISAFIFSACAPKVSQKDFDQFANKVKQAYAKHDATAVSHLQLTQDTRNEVADLKKKANQMRFMVGFTALQLGKLERTTAQWIVIFMKALEYKGIKVDLAKTIERMTKEEMEKKLKEKSK